MELYYKGVRVSDISLNVYNDNNVEKVINDIDSLDIDIHSIFEIKSLLALKFGRDVTTADKEISNIMCLFPDVKYNFTHKHFVIYEFRLKGNLKDILSFLFISSIRNFFREVRDFIDDDVNLIRGLNRGGEISTPYDFSLILIYLHDRGRYNNIKKTFDILCRLGYTTRNILLNNVVNEIYKTNIDSLYTQGNGNENPLSMRSIKEETISNILEYINGE